MVEVLKGKRNSPIIRESLGWIALISEEGAAINWIASRFESGQIVTGRDEQVPPM